MKRWVKVGRRVAIAISAGMAVWVTEARGQTASAPATLPQAVELQAILPNLASAEFVRREAGQKELEKVPADQYESVAALAAKQTDPEVKARLDARAAEMLEQLTDKSSPAPLRAMALVEELKQSARGLKEFTGGEQQLIRDIGPLGNAAIRPAQAALGKAQTELERRYLVLAIGNIMTPEAKGVLLDLLADKDDAVNSQAMISLAQRIREDGVLPVLAQALPDEKNEMARIAVCVTAKDVLKPVDPAGKPDATLVSQTTDMLRERLRNDASGEVRMWAAAQLTEFGDNSGLPELEKDALAMAAKPRGALFRDGAGLFWAEIVLPAMEKATGQKFGPATLDPNPMGAKTSPLMPEVYYENRKARLDAAVAWINAHPSTEPATK